ncbi:MAG: hypothetical protein OEM41_01575 [Ignavibacteria bacterium]|nr:hypothetical protein [Ignavibacteria bacterium]
MKETTTLDLLQCNTIANAASDAGWKNLSPGIRAIWTVPIEGEDNAPQHRIIHCRLMQHHTPARLRRLGIRPAPGYHKCGSSVQTDWVAAFRLLVWKGDRWEVLMHERSIPRPHDDGYRWFDLGEITTSAAIIELRECEIDRWWTSWNLAEKAFTLEGVTESVHFPRNETRLSVGEIDLAGVPSGITAERRSGEVRFRTPSLEVGFWMGRPGFSHLSIDDESNGQTEQNLLRHNPAVFLQGLMIQPVGVPPAVSPILRSDLSGTARVRGNTVTYDVSVNTAGQRYLLEWRVLEDALAFRFQRHGEATMRTWESSVWNIVCNSEAIPTVVLGHTERKGQSGLLNLPVLFHAPGHGTLHIALHGGNGICRSDSCRPHTFASFELKVGEIPQPEGDYLLPAGDFQAEGEMSIYHYASQAQSTAPRAVARALQRCSLTAMTYRADTGTLSNNGNSIHAPLCMDNWSAVATRLGDLLPGVSATDLLRDSLERWLDGGPGYASGGMAGNGTTHLAEDEYIMTGTAGLLGVAEFLTHGATRTWVNSYGPQIAQQLALMKGRDVDGDGIVESIYRHGMSGGNQWSTGWYDVICFGWKDAFSNALLFRALTLLISALPRHGRDDLATGLEEWAAAMKANYVKVFFNERTGWLAGWRCRKGDLHDYAFLAVNGAAVCSGVIDQNLASNIMRALWSESQRVGIPDPRLGLPGNLWPVADADMVELMHGKPMGYYLNGGLTHSQSRHFVGALYKVGMRDEADALLESLCETLADGTAFGGCNSGVDWRYWDGAPCGYEGILTDQFGILAVALDRYGQALPG